MHNTSHKRVQQKRSSRLSHKNDSKNPSKLSTTTHTQPIHSFSRSLNSIVNNTNETTANCRPITQHSSHIKTLKNHLDNHTLHNHHHRHLTTPSHQSPSFSNSTNHLSLSTTNHGTHNSPINTPQRGYTNPQKNIHNHHNNLNNSPFTSQRRHNNTDAAIGTKYYKEKQVIHKAPKIEGKQRLPMNPFISKKTHIPFEEIRDKLRILTKSSSTPSPSAENDHTIAASQRGLKGGEYSGLFMGNNKKTRLSKKSPIKIVHHSSIENAPIPDRIVTTAGKDTDGFYQVSGVYVSGQSLMQTVHKFDYSEKFTTYDSLLPERPGAQKVSQMRESRMQLNGPAKRIGQGVRWATPVNTVFHEPVLFRPKGAKNGVKSRTIWQAFPNTAHVFNQNFARIEKLSFDDIPMISVGPGDADQHEKDMKIHTFVPDSKNLGIVKDLPDTASAQFKKNLMDELTRLLVIKQMIKNGIHNFKVRLPLYDLSKAENRKRVVDEFILWRKINLRLRDKQYPDLGGISRWAITASIIITLVVTIHWFRYKNVELDLVEKDKWMKKLVERNIMPADILNTKSYVASSTGIHTVDPSLVEASIKRRVEQDIYYTGIQQVDEDNDTLMKNIKDNNINNINNININNKNNNNNPPTNPTHDSSLNHPTGQRFDIKQHMRQLDLPVLPPSLGTQSVGMQNVIPIVAIEGDLSSLTLLPTKVSTPSTDDIVSAVASETGWRQNRALYAETGQQIESEMGQNDQNANGFSNLPNFSHLTKMGETIVEKTNIKVSFLEGLLAKDDGEGQIEGGDQQANNEGNDQTGQNDLKNIKNNQNDPQNVKTLQNPSKKLTENQYSPSVTIDSSKSLPTMFSTATANGVDDIMSFDDFDREVNALLAQQDADLQRIHAQQQKINSPTRSYSSSSLSSRGFIKPQLQVEGVTLEETRGDGVGSITNAPNGPLGQDRQESHNLHPLDQSSHQSSQNVVRPKHSLQPSPSTHNQYTLIKDHPSPAVLQRVLEGGHLKEALGRDVVETSTSQQLHSQEESSSQLLQSPPSPNISPNPSSSSLSPQSSLHALPGKHIDQSYIMQAGDLVWKASQSIGGAAVAGTALALIAPLSIPLQLGIIGGGYGAVNLVAAYGYDALTAVGILGGGGTTNTAIIDNIPTNTSSLVSNNINNNATPHHVVATSTTSELEAIVGDNDSLRQLTKATSVTTTPASNSSQSPTLPIQQEDPLAEFQRMVEQNRQQQLMENGSNGPNGVVKRAPYNPALHYGSMGTRAQDEVVSTPFPSHWNRETLVSNSSRSHKPSNIPYSPSPTSLIERFGQGGYEGDDFERKLVQMPPVGTTNNTLLQIQNNTSLGPSTAIGTNSQNPSSQRLTQQKFHNDVIVKELNELESRQSLIRNLRKTVGEIDEEVDEM